MSTLIQNHITDRLSLRPPESVITSSDGMYPKWSKGISRTLLKAYYTFA